MNDQSTPPVKIPGYTPEERKQFVKDAIKEWLDERYISVGRWTVRTLAAAVFAALVYIILIANGWHKL